MTRTRVRKTLTGFAVLVVLGPAPAGARIYRSAWVADGMILQADRPIVVTGRGHDGGKVTVSIAGRTGTATVSNGVWKVVLDPLKVGGPHEMTLTQDGAAVTIKDVLVGEVWMLGGQSNMGCQLKGRYSQPEVFDSAKDDRFPDIRFGTDNKWLKATPEGGLEHFPAVGYYMARRLHRELKRPIGLVIRALPGQSVVSFVDPDMATSAPAVRRLLAVQERRAAGVKAKKYDWRRYPPEKGFGPNPWPYGGEARGLGVWVQGVYSLQAFPVVRGIVWWQGEEDMGTAAQYEPLLRCVVRSWRAMLPEGRDLPFIWIQLPTYMPGPPKAPGGPEARGGLAGLRDAQRRVLSEPNTAQAVTLDIYDAGGIHPMKKAEYGERLATAVLGHVYRKREVYMGPLYKEAAVKGNRMVVTFDHCSTGMEAKGGGEPEGFVIAGEDRKFVPAQARVTGKNTMEVWNDGVSKPVAVRYAWHANPIFNLYNKEGLPASPFRTDDWQLYPVP